MFIQDFRGSHSRLKYVIPFSKFNYWSKEHSYVCKISNKSTKREIKIENAQPPIPEYKSHSSGTNKLNDGSKRSKCKKLIHICFIVFSVNIPKPYGIFTLPIIEPYNHNSLNTFLYKR